MKLEIEPLDLTLAETFTISRESQDVAHNLLVRVTAQVDGREITGLGECPPHPFIGAPVDTCRAVLEDLAGRPDVLGTDPFDQEGLERRLKEAAEACPPARMAIDIAVHDIIGQALGVPLWKLWGLDATKAPRTSFTIGISDPDHMVEKARMAKAQGYPILKIKLGTPDDVAVARAIRKATGCTLRVDDNCAWTPEQAIEIGRELET